MNIFKRLINNCAKPENNCFGKTILVGMNISHGKVSKWGFSQFYLNHEKKFSISVVEAEKTSEDFCMSCLTTKYGALTAPVRVSGHPQN